MGARRTEDRIDRALADAHANGDSDGAAPLRWALSELDRVTAEAIDSRTRAMLLSQSESDPTARADLRALKRNDAAGGRRDAEHE